MTTATATATATSCPQVIGAVVAAPAAVVVEVSVVGAVVVTVVDRDTTRLLTLIVLDSMRYFKEAAVDIIIKK